MGFFDNLGSMVKNLGFNAVSLEEAQRSAPQQTGVYKLFLNGRLMKVGKAAWDAGIRWRMQQYWRGDSTAGSYGSEIYKNRKDITVSWILCPKDKCRAIELNQIQSAGGIDNLPWCERI
ncbi:MAG TPA: hypothetical protein VHY08_20820 [Bacillota bacterium]|nr:hypothetical protein [Bacillota bacterium]